MALCPASVQGPFDFINFANHADIEPVFVTTSTTSVQDFAELVECKSLSGYSWSLRTAALLRPLSDLVDDVR